MPYHRRQALRIKRNRRHTLRVCLSILILSCIWYAGELLQQPHKAAAPAARPVSSAPAAPQTASSPPIEKETAPTPPKQDWQLRLVNAAHPLPASFSVQTATVGNIQLDSRAAPDLRRLLQDGRAAGYRLVTCSGYRSIPLQTSLYQRKLRYEEQQGLHGQEAVQAAAAVVAKPATSEHNLGLAVDFGSETNQLLDETFAKTPESRWLAETAWRYGFILRYPKGKEDTTGVIYEPWHYRYVGTQAAKEIQQRGVCLEEYLGTA